MGTYIYGAPENLGSWNHVASIFAAHDSVHSEETSSLPLVQFWQPRPRNAGLRSRVIKFLKESGFEDEFTNACFCFEHSIANGKGGASMTDLMILTEKHVVAIEAKWTECVKEKEYEPISDWRKGIDSDNGEKVLTGWLTLINGYLGKGKSPIRHDNKIIEGVPYQLLHRIASACAIANGREASIIYQLFYGGDITKEDALRFAKTLKMGYASLFNNAHPIRFRTILSQVEKCKDFEKIKEQCKRGNALFRKMQTKCLYKFPLESIQDTEHIH